MAKNKERMEQQKASEKAWDGKYTQILWCASCSL